MTPVEPLGIVFQINDVTALEATIIAAERRTGSDDPEVRLTIEVAPPAWETADLLMLFHLDWDARREGSVSGAQPVQIELRLDADAANPDDLPQAPETLAAAISGAADDSPLRAETSWYALAVTEPVDLPPELAGKGNVRSGFTTTWADTESS